MREGWDGGLILQLERSVYAGDKPNGKPWTSDERAAEAKRRIKSVDALGSYGQDRTYRNIKRFASLAQLFPFLLRVAGEVNFTIIVVQRDLQPPAPLHSPHIFAYDWRREYNGGVRVQYL